MMGRTPGKLSYVQILEFFIPLAISAMLMMASHSIVSSAMARTNSAATALAAYAVAQSISTMFESPCYNIRRMAIALLDGKDSSKNIFIVAAAVTLVVIALMLAVAYTPLANVVFVQLVGIDVALLPQVLSAFRVFLLLPLVSALRAYYQAFIIVGRKTYIMSLNIVVRLVVMMGVSSFVLKSSSLNGSAVGAVVLVSGIGTEAILALIAGRRIQRSLPNEPKRDQAVTVLSALQFFIPLLAAVFVQTFGRPIINAGLARTVNPEVALASYQIAWSFAWILGSTSFSVHQLVLVLVEDSYTYTKVKNFVWIVGITTTAALLLTTVTPVGPWVLIHIIGVDANLAQPANQIVAVLAFAPLLICLSELYAGLLMRNGRTSVVTVSKSAYIGAVALTSLVIGRLYPQLGGMLAGISMISGYLAELAVVFIKSRDVIPVVESESLEVFEFNS